MAEARTNTSYYALRVRPETPATDWWAAAHAQGATAPPPVKALLGGRSRVELSAEEAVSAIDWAARLAGWGDWGQHPIFIYPPPDAARG